MSYIKEEHLTYFDNWPGTRHSYEVTCLIFQQSYEVAKFIKKDIQGYIKSYSFAKRRIKTCTYPAG